MTEEEEDSGIVNQEKSTKPINNKEVFGSSKIQIKIMKDMKDMKDMEDLDEQKEE